MKLGVLLKKDINDFFHIRVYFFSIVCLLITFYEVNGAYGVLTEEEFVLNMLTNNVYMYFALVPIYVYTIYNCCAESNSCVIIRLKRMGYYYLEKSICCMIISVLYVGIQIFISVMLATTLTDKVNHDYMFYYENVRGCKEHFSSIDLAIVVQSAYLILGMSFIGILVILATHFINKYVAIILVAIEILLAGICQSGIIEKNNYIVNFLSLKTYLFYPEAIQYRMVPSIWIIVIFSLGSLWYMIKFWWKKRL